MRCLSNFAAAVIVVAMNIAGVAAWLRCPTIVAWENTEPKEIRPLDISVGVEGKEPCPGSGTAAERAPLFLLPSARYAMGRTWKERGCPECLRLQRFLLVPLAGGKGTINTPKQLRTVGSWWPFATTIWDYINRAMPRFQGGSLKPNEVYALTALILYKNDIIKETDVLDAKTLPKIQMPNRGNFLPARLEDIHDLKKRGCRLGQCTETTNSK